MASKKSKKRKEKIKEKAGGLQEGKPSEKMPAKLSENLIIDEKVDDEKKAVNFFSQQLPEED